MTHLNRPSWIGHDELRPQKAALGIPADADMMPIDMARCLVLVWVDSAHLATRADRIERGGEL